MTTQMTAEHLAALDDAIRDRRILFQGMGYPANTDTRGRSLTEIRVSIAKQMEQPK